MSANFLGVIDSSEAKSTASITLLVAISGSGLLSGRLSVISSGRLSGGVIRWCLIGRNVVEIVLNFLFFVVLHLLVRQKSCQFAGF